MIQFLQFTEENRRQLIAQVSTITDGMRVQAIEKDWWVTLVLKALFSLPMREHFIFKGGTSLSKGWQLIDRFSEDIDIALSPKAFGREYRPAPSHSYVKTLKREGCTYTSSVIKDALHKSLIEMGVPSNMITVEAEAVRDDMRDKDPQTLYVRFLSLYEPSGYIVEPVKIEFGVRALREPFSTVKIQSILGRETLSPTYSEESFEVPAVEPRKTFMEKMMLLHEKYLLGIKPDAGERQSRHLYDLFSLSRKGIADQVLDDEELYSALQTHRQHYVRLKGIDYSTMHLTGLAFIPPFELLEQFRRDYEKMRPEMIFGDVPDFDTMLSGLRELNLLLIAKKQKRTVDDIIAKAIELIANQEGQFLVSHVIYKVEAGQPLGPLNTAAQFRVEFIQEGTEYVVHRIIQIS
ncbi:Nucleotidyl transferase AbiEii toxin, Type IV TA system [Hydrobacter penzbergensis]|uniref:Nucleotidyl transferase AbiEii toxin, Type IV TA system n=1 Tax=Hydrobacter penzbergensis TaxID=1235997 RepID=A0A8X8ICW7_9BACT|nr:nucleotidyl transferase AbiEii/AbiGii toxin family protein [Hydrobacter penzbergensis]SDX01636.1 Nucleotidyl transferase AbiEii toxin, Type IV TA system [Hydrobacter penzbergensis]